MPESFYIADGTEDEKLILLNSKELNTDVIIEIDDSNQFSSSQAVLKNIFEKLSADGSFSKVTWRGQNCTISNFKMKNNAFSENQQGWAAAIPLPSKKAVLTCLAYTSEQTSFDKDQLLLSILDSIMIDNTCFKSSGLITTFAYPKTKNKEIKIEIANKSVTSFIDENDSKAAQFVIDREFSVFKLFASSKYWKTAWQRFYRQIAKDSSQRLKRFSLDIDAVLSDKTKQQKAQYLLTWMQNQTFEQPAANTPDKADFVCPTDILLGKSSDCDSRSLLIAVVLNLMNIESCIFVSPEYSHALTGIYLPDSLGQSIQIDGKNFLLAETTEKNISIGTIRAEFQNKSKWIPIEFF